MHMESVTLQEPIILSPYRNHMLGGFNLGRSAESMDLELPESSSPCSSYNVFVYLCDLEMVFEARDCNVIILVKKNQEIEKVQFLADMVREDFV